MRDAFPSVSELANGSFMGAEAWLNQVLRRSHWLYAQAHSREYMQRQGIGETTGALTVYEAETRYRAEHPTLSISARMNLSGTPSAKLQYYGADSAWHTFSGGEDTTAGDRWFAGSAEVTFDCSGLSLPDDGMLRVRLTITAGSAAVYWAVMTGWVGLAAWPTLPTFADTPTIHDDDDFNTLVTAQEYLLDCAEQPAVAIEQATATHTQASSYQALLRYVFRHSARQNVYAYLTVSGLAAGEHVYVYLEDAQYPHGSSGSSRLATLFSISSDGSAAHTASLSSLGLTQGARYCVEINAPDGVQVTVHNLQTVDGTGLSRAYLAGGFVHGAQPTASDLNKIKNDLNQMYPEASRNSPLWYGHALQQYVIWDASDSLVFSYTGHGFRLCHRWRYLRWRGAGYLRSVDGANEVSLSDTSPGGGAQVMDLETVTWLAYGMQFDVVSEGTKALLTVHEDYAP